MMRHREANGVDTASPHVSRGGRQFLKNLREGMPKAKRVCFYFHSSKPFNTGGVDDRFGPNIKEAKKVASCLQTSIKAAPV